jgi:hypothetical protein
MRSISGIILCMLAMGAMLLAQEKSALETNPQGWVDLLPDKAFKGWTRLNLAPSAQLAEVSPWQIDSGSGVLVCNGDKSGHEMLRYDRELANFIVHLEFSFAKLETENPRYNSGFYVRNNADASLWHQAQIGASSGGFLFGNTLVKGEKQRINLRDQIKENRVGPAGEWNTFEIRAEGKKISLWVNGAVTTVFDACELPRGYLGFEAEGFKISFRNIKLKELP